MSLSSWTSLFFGYSFNEAHHTSECEFIQRRIFSFLSVFSAWHDIGIWVSSISQIMCLHSPTKKRSLKNHHMLAFWRFIPHYQSWSQVCFSLLMHTWLIESGVFSCPGHLLLIGRVEDKRPFYLLYSAYYYSLLTASESHLLSP